MWRPSCPPARLTEEEVVGDGARIMFYCAAIVIWKQRLLE